MFNLLKKGIFISISIILSYGQSSNSVVFTEVMFNTNISNIEFIEIFNPSFNNSVDLNSLKLKYSSSKTDELLVYSNSSILPPRSYAVILEKDYDFEENIYKLEEDLIILTTSDNAFGRSGLANSSDRNIVLFDKNLDTLDIHTYKANNPKNYSDEKINIEKENLDNWGNSEIEFGTPGKKNSITPPDFDVKVKIVDFQPEKPFYGETIHINYEIKNVGLKNTSNINLKVYIDFNRDSIAQNNEVLHQNFVGMLSPGDSIKKEVNFKNIYHGKNLFIVEASAEKDYNRTNNKDFKEVLIIKPVCEFNDIVINEIMFAPYNEEPEWIEIYNNSTSTINLQNWTIRDKNSKSTLIKDKLEIFPYSYLVIAKDDSFIDYYTNEINYIVSAFPSLNNSGDHLIIKDSLGITIDSTSYLGEWVNNKKGKSLERKDVTISSFDTKNWEVSQKRATPGLINSVTIKDYNIKIDSAHILPKQPILNETISFSVTVSNYGKNECEYSLHLYKIEGEDKNKLEILSNLLVSPEMTELVRFNYTEICKTDSIKYEIELFCNEDFDQTNNNYRLEANPVSTSGKILFSEIMFNPEDNSPEWIEFYNKSDYPVNLRGWSFVNYSTSSYTKSTIYNSVIIKPNEYFIVLSDKNELNADSKVIELNIGSLSNLDDKLCFKNYVDETSDSIYYHSGWKNIKGKSIERVSFDDKNEEKNWHFSLNENNSSIGNENSVNNLNNYTFGDLSINEIMYNPGSSNSEFIEIYNHTNYSVDLGGWELIESENSTILTDNFMELNPGEYYVIANDSVLFNSFPELKEKVFILNSFSLSNTTELITIIDAFGNIIDSVRYNDNWNNSNYTNTTNKSLEKIIANHNSNDQENWSTSVNQKGSTPSQKNSIKLDNKNNVKDNISISPNPFSPDNDGFEDFTEIQFNLKSPVSQIIVRIFDDIGRLVRTIENYSAAGSEGIIIYDGKDDNGIPLGIGIYILLFEAYDINDSSKISFQKPIVVARKL